MTYLYAPERMAPVLRLWPDAKFVIAVRDPMEMLPSLHLRLLFNGDEVEPDFERAWSLAARRREGKEVPRTCVDPRWLDYDEIVRIGKYVDRFIAAIGRERCFVSVFDDLASDPEAVYREMLEFLDLRYHPRPDFSPQRTSRGYRFGALQRLLKRPPKIARSVLGGEKTRLRVTARPDRRVHYLVRQIMEARKRLLDWNTVEGPPSAIPLRLQLEIKDRLRDDIAHLSRVIGRNLDHWLSPRPPSPAGPISFGAARPIEPSLQPREAGVAARRLMQPVGDRRVAGSPWSVGNGH